MNWENIKYPLIILGFSFGIGLIEKVIRDIQWKSWYKTMTKRAFSNDTETYRKHQNEIDKRSDRLDIVIKKFRMCYWNWKQNRCIFI